jgi:MFS-type transporter involved in bile tolerance (Atg22 family)
MFVMTISILGGIIFSLFVVKRIQKGTMNIAARDARWGALGNSVFFLVIVAVFIIPGFIDYSHTGIVKLSTLIVSAVAGVLIDTAARKFHVTWLRTFALAFSMVIAMASSVLWDSLLKMGGY